MAAFVTGLIMVAGGWESYGVAWKRTAVIVLLVADIGAVAGISFLLLPKESPLSIQNLSPETTFISKITGSAILADSAGKALGDFRTRIEEFLGPEAVAASIRSKFRQSGADFLCLSTYQLTGVMSFYAPDNEYLTWLPDHGRVRFPWINDSTWKGKTALVAEWPRRGPSYSALFAELSPAQPLLVEGADRAHQHLGVRGSRLRAPLDGDDVPSLEGGLELGARLSQKFLAVGKNQHLPARHPREFREDHGLSRPGGQADHHAPHAAAARRKHRGNRLGLVRSQADKGSRHLAQTLPAGRRHGNGRRPQT
jgi:hypothetical protein